MRYFRPFSTLAVGVVLGVVVWPRIRSQMGS